MAGPDLSHRLADALATRAVTPDERGRVVDAAILVDTWAELPVDVRTLVERIEERPGWAAGPRPPGR